MVPDDWKTSRVVPLFKFDNREEMDNYRPISVLAVISKITEKVVYHQLFSYLNASNPLSSCQSGFRKNFSTETAVTLFVDEIRRNVDNGLLTGAVFIDLKKAFDTIDQHILLNKLQRYGVCNRTPLWLSSYLLVTDAQDDSFMTSRFSSPYRESTGVQNSSDIFRKSRSTFLKYKTMK